MTRQRCFRCQISKQKKEYYMCKLRRSQENKARQRTGLRKKVEHWTTDSLSVLKYRRRTQPNTRYEARRLPVPKGRSCFPSKPVPQEDIPIPTIEQYDTVYTMYRIQHHSSKPVLDRRSMCPSPTPPALGPKLFPNARPSRRVSKQSSISRGGSGDMISREELQYAFDWKKRTMEA